jgi:hypothetical protein
LAIFEGADEVEENFLHLFILGRAVRRICHKFLLGQWPWGCARGVRRLNAILLHRRQAREIAKTLLPHHCASEVKVRRYCSLTPTYH